MSHICLWMIKVLIMFDLSKLANQLRIFLFYSKYFSIFILNASSPAICISFSAVFISVTTTQLIALDVEVFSIGA